MLEGRFSTWHLPSDFGMISWSWNQWSAVLYYASSPSARDHISVWDWMIWMDQIQEHICFLTLERYLGPSTDIGPMMTAKCLKANGQCTGPPRDPWHQMRLQLMMKSRREMLWWSYQGYTWSDLKCQWLHWHSYWKPTICTISRGFGWSYGPKRWGWQWRGKTRAFGLLCWSWGMATLWGSTGHIQCMQQKEVFSRYIMRYTTCESDPWY